MWPVGFLLAAIGTVCASLGHLLFRLSARLEAGLPLLKRKRWLAAAFLEAVILSVFNSFALQFAPLSMVTPCAGLSMVWSVWMGHVGCLGVHERLKCTDVVCSALVLCGVTLVAVSEGVGGRVQPTAKQLAADAGSVYFVAYWLVFATLGITWLSGVGGAVRARYPIPSVFFSALFGAAAASLTQAFVKLLGGLFHDETPHWCAKRTASSHAQRDRPGSSESFDATAIRPAANSSIMPLHRMYLETALGLATMAPLDLLLLGRTIQSAALALAVPAYQSFVITLGAAVGTVFFSESAGYSPLRWTGFVAGLLLVVMGVATLGYSHRDDRSEDMDPSLVCNATGTHLRQPPPGSHTHNAWRARCSCRAHGARRLLARRLPLVPNTTRPRPLAHHPLRPPDFSVLSWRAQLASRSHPAAERSDACKAAAPATSSTFAPDAEASGAAPAVERRPEVDLTEPVRHHAPACARSRSNSSG